ncbi:hypothetical protein FSARC_4035 [Fusarium sarcochroum]|uniref:Regulatory protein n=1 Tax=Fusarium sarcochroum TaxID=1208366 RepID=A0A8H4XBY4_9HYPO|nr:hypothetical protein FSARC_4035 [Fusarium sarcochroum]
MDDESQVRAELTRIKHVVKQNFRRVKKVQNKRIHIRDDEPPRRGSGSGTRTTLHRTAVEDTPASPSDQTSGETPCIWAPSLVQESAFRETALLMHYLDYIFPLQYPYYHDNPKIGGRGWLLWLLTKNTPLHQAMLTLAALHQQVTFAAGSEQVETELIEYHTKALGGLRQALCVGQDIYLPEHSDKLINIVACGAFLISFELLRGGKNDWQAHLNALCSIASKLSPPTHILADSSTTTKEVQPDVARSLGQARRNAQDFLFCAVLWFDILGCTSTGVQPRMPYQSWLNSERIDMASVLGCENWVMEVIGDLATVDASQGWLSPAESHGLLSDALQRLNEGTTALRAREPPLPISHHVTRVFAAAAIVQVQALMLEKDENRGNLVAVIDQTIDAFQQFPDGVSVRTLMWPVCIAGCLASGDQQAFFEQLMVGICEQGNARIGSCESVMQVLRYCWDRRATNTTGVYGWRKAMMELDAYILLV